VGDHAEAAATMIASLVLFHHALSQQFTDGTYAAEILVTRSLMIWNAAIYCTQVARNSVMVLMR
jgi:hypothetical protein